MSLLDQPPAATAAPGVPGQTAPAPSPSAPSSGAFPGFGDRFRRMWNRLAGKPLTFFALTVIATALMAAFGFGAVLLSVVAVPFALAGGPLVLLPLGLGIGVVATVLQAATLGAFANAAAFKIRAGRAVALGFRMSLATALTLVLASLALTVPGFLFIPAIVMSLRFGLLLPVIVNERRAGIEALARSRDLVYGMTGKYFGGLLVMFGGSLLLSIVAGALRSQVLAGIVSFLTSFFIVPLYVLYAQVFYEDCVARKGRDWVMRPSRANFYRAMAALGALVFVGMFAGTAFLFPKAASLLQSFKPSVSVNDVPTKTDLSPVVAAPAVNANVAAAPAPAVNAPAPETPKPPATPGDRDLERYRNVNDIRIALDSYEKEQNAYPATLAALTPKYLHELPTDPTSAAAYGYETKFGGFIITFGLEEGVFSLAAGTHTLTNKGFDVPLTEPIAHVPEQSTTVTAIPAPPVPETPANPLPPEPGTEPVTTPGSPAAGTPPGVVPPPPAPTVDTDGDGLPDLQETTIYHTDPKKADTDGDGFSDGDEVYADFDPLNPAKGARLLDTDGDGLPDEYEVANGLDPNVKDMDKDGLSDGDEVRVYGTDPKKADTDGDGFDDAAELQRGFDPNGPGKLTQEQQDLIKADAAKYGLH